MECYTNEKPVLKKYQVGFLLLTFPHFYTCKYVPFYTEFRIHKINNFANLQWPLKIYVYYKNIYIRGCIFLHILYATVNSSIQAFFNCPQRFHSNSKF